MRRPIQDNRVGATMPRRAYENTPLPRAGARCASGSKLMAWVVALAAGIAVPPAVAGEHTGHVAMALGDLEFMPIEGVPIEIAVLWGNPQEGESAVMMKFPPNFPGGLHIHTNGYHGIVVTGASKHWIEGETEAEAPLQTPGDYWYQTGGQVHQDSFPTGEETILFLQFEGPIDTTFVQ